MEKFGWEILSRVSYADFAAVWGVRFLSIVVFLLSIPDLPWQWSEGEYDEPFTVPLSPGHISQNIVSSDLFRSKSQLKGVLAMNNIKVF